MHHIKKHKVSKQKARFRHQIAQQDLRYLTVSLNAKMRYKIVGHLRL